MIGKKVIVVFISIYTHNISDTLPLLESLYFRPIFNVEHSEEITSLSYPNANALIKALSDIGLVEEITGQKRNRAFSYAPYLAVFRDS